MAEKHRSILSLPIALAWAALLSTFAPALPLDEAWKSFEEKAEKAFVEGRLNESEELWRAALGAAEKKSQQGPDVATVLNQMTHLFLRQHRYQEAQAALSRALQIREKSLGKDNLLTLETMGNLALVKHKLGEDKEALNLYRQCVAAKKKTEPKSPSTAITLTNLANLYSEMYRYPEAAKLYSEALQIDTDALGSGHPEVARDLFNLGALNFKCSHFEEAIQHLKQAEKAYQALNDRSGQANALHYLGLCHAKLKDPAKAAEHYKEALRLKEETTGMEHPEAIVHKLSLATALDESGKNDEAEELYLKTLSNIKSAKQPHHLRLTECEVDIAHFYRRHGQKEKAEAHFKNALNSYELLSRHEKRKLYELPRAYASLLHELKRDSEGDAIAKKYLHVYSPERNEHMKF
ncbi:MAG TPA: tetratricopeptide repeat protein [Candidatus Obscuribacterales bacterium]